MQSASASACRCSAPPRRERVPVRPCLPTRRTTVGERRVVPIRPQELFCVGASRMHSQEKLRKYLKDGLPPQWSLSRLSKHLGYNHAYLQQFLNRNTPKELDPRDIQRIVEATGVDEVALGVAAQPTETSRMLSRLREVPEYDALASAGGGISLDEQRRGNWPFLAEYIESELRLRGSALAITQVKGDSMEPTLRSGDRILIDMSDKNVSQPGLFALWDGDGRVVKRVERIPAADPPTLVLKSDNPLHSEYRVP